MPSQIVVLSFEGAGTAAGVLDNLRDMERRGLLRLDDAIVASRPPREVIVADGPDDGSGSMFLQNAASASRGTIGARVEPVEIEQTDSRRGRTAAAGAGVGLLAGWLIGGPVGGAAVGAVLGALRDRGLSDGFVKSLSEGLQADTSAVFLLVKEADAPRVLEELRPFGARVMHTSLPPEQEEALRRSLGGRA
jgi:uncharacterized membrane protein